MYISPNSSKLATYSSEMFPPACYVTTDVLKALVVFLLLFVKLSVAKPWEVKVGGLFDLESYEGKESKVGIEMAIEDVNNNHTVLNGIHLHLQAAEIGSSPLVNAGNVLNLFRGNVAAVVAPMTAEVSNFVSFVADSAQVPLITFAGSYPSMSTKHSRYSIQMIGSDPMQMKAIASVLNKFYWREIVVIFQDDELGVNGILALNNALQEASASARARIVQKFPVTDSFNKSTLDEIVQKLKHDKTRSRVFLVHTSYELAQKIFLEAKGLDIMKQQGHVWIVTEWVASFLKISDYKTMDSMQGVIGIRKKIPESLWFRDVSRRVKDKFRRLYPEECHSEKIGIVGAHAYDSIWIIARALDALFSDDKLNKLEFKSSGKYSADVQVFQEGNALFEKAIGTGFEGISGNMTFDKNGILQVDSYEILNVADREIRVVGFWREGQGMLSLKWEENQEITWPNGSSKPPSGYRKFIVGVPRTIVFHEFVNVSQISSSAFNFSGFCVDVFKRCVANLPYHMEYEFRPSFVKEDAPDYDQLVEQVANKTFDAIVADITIRQKRAAKVDFTQPFTDTGLVIMVPTKKTKSSAWAFLKPFTISMWFTMAAFVILTAFLIWMLERGTNDAFTGKPIKQMEISLWFSFSTIVFAHREKVMTSLGRMILMIWMFVVLILNSSYTASLTSILTVQQLSSTIIDIETLRTSGLKVGHLTGSFVEDYLVNGTKIEKSRLRPLAKPQEYADSLRNGTVGAIVDEIPYIRMIMSQHCGEFEIVGQPFYRGGFGFLFSKGSPVVPEMTFAVLNLTQNRTQLEDIRNYWFGQDSSSSLTSCDGNSINEEQIRYDSGRLSPSSFWGLFVIITAAYCLLVFAYFGLKFYKARQISPMVEDVQSTPPETPFSTLQSGHSNSDLSSSLDVSSSSIPFPPRDVFALALPTRNSDSHILRPFFSDLEMVSQRRRRAQSA